MTSVSIAVLFFQLMNGVPLADTGWHLAVFAFIVTVAAFAPIALDSVQRMLKNPKQKVLVIILLVLWFLMLFPLGLGVPLAQNEMLTQCQSIERVISIKDTEINSLDTHITECRYKTNYYGEYGPWEIETIKIVED